MGGGGRGHAETMAISAKQRSVEIGDNQQVRPTEAFIHMGTVQHAKKCSLVNGWTCNKGNTTCTLYK